MRLLLGFAQCLGAGVISIHRDTVMCHYFGYFSYGAPGFLGIFMA